jgi:DNA-binding NarL/FixJ family response regulator
MFLIATASASFLSHARNIPAVGDGWITVGDFASLIETLRCLTPPLVLLDLALPGLPRGQRLAALRAASRSSKVIGLYHTHDAESELDCFKYGNMKGYCPISLDTVGFNRVIAAVERGELWICRSLVARLLDELQEANVEPLASATRCRNLTLTHREQEIALLVCAGRSNKQIARALDITERTVKAHMSEIFRKTGIADRLMLALRLTGHTGAPAAPGATPVAPSMRTSVPALQ